MQEVNTKMLKMNYFKQKLKSAKQEGSYFLKELFCGNSGCPILRYHKVQDLVIYDKFNVNVGDFEKQMEYLFKKNFRTISLDEYVRYDNNNEEIPSNYFVLTFDDGYEDFYINALPILKKYNFKATVFIVSGLIGHVNKWDIEKGYSACPLMNKTMIREVVKEGIEIGSHTVTHPDLSRCSDDVIDCELNESKRVLETIIGSKINFLAYPFGKFKEQVRAIAIKNHYVRALATSSDVYNDKFTIGRIGVVNGVSARKVFTKMILQVIASKKFLWPKKRASVNGK